MSNKVQTPILQLDTWTNRQRDHSKHQQIDTQIDIYIDRQTHRQIYTQIDIYKLINQYYRLINEQEKDRHIDRYIQIDKSIHRLINGQEKDRYIDRLIEMIERQIDFKKQK